MFEEARRLINIGLPIIPICSHDHAYMSAKHIQRCKCAGKTPIIKNWQLRNNTTEKDLQEWIQQFKSFNIGLPLGDASGYCGIDIDGDEGEVMLQNMSKGEIPETWEFSTGAGRRLIYLIPPGTKTKKFKQSDKDKGHNECALMCTGQQTVLPPSIHYSGKIYAWKEQHSPWDIDCAMAPNWLVNLIRVDDLGNRQSTGFTLNLSDAPLEETDSDDLADEFEVTDFSDNIPVEILNNQAVVKTQNKGKSGHSIVVTEEMLTQPIPEGQRDVTMTAIIGHYCANRDFRRLGKQFVMQVCMQHNQNYCDPPLDEDAIKQKVNYFFEAEQMKESKFKEGKSDRLQFEASKAAALVRNKLQTKGLYIYFDQNSKMYYYTTPNKGPWICSRDVNVINKWIRQIITTPPEGTPQWDKHSFIDETRRALEEIYTDAFRQADTFDLGAHAEDLSKYIVTNNGLVDWQTEELLPWTPDYHTTIAFNVDYDPDAKCPRFEQYMEQWLPDELVRNVVQEYLGYCLIPNTRFRKALFLYGKGKNGKSMLLEFLQNFFGEYKSALSYDGLFQRFGTANLKDKLVNIFDDTTVSFVKDTGIVKNLIAGGTIMAEFKGKDHFTFTNVARFIFSAQETPKTSDRSEAWYDRWIFIKFPNKFKASNAKKLEMETAMQKELPGIFNWMLDGLRRLMEQDGFTESEALTVTSQEYRSQNDSIAMFVNSMCKECDKGNGTPVHTLFKIYSTWAEYEGLRAISKRTFTDRIEDLGYKKKKGYVNGKSGQTFISGLVIDKECEDYTENTLEYSLALQI